MKHQQYTTAQPTGPTLSAIGTWAMRLRQVHQRLAPYFARPEAHQHALLYLQALLSDIPRKNGWQIAEHARELRPYGMQRLLSRAVWDQDGVRDELRALVCQSLHPPPALPTSPAPEQVFPVLVLDESGFPKRGRHSAGVGQQYCGATGQVANCQVGVFLSYVTALSHALIDRELYLPQDWCADRPRRLAAHIPDHVSFQTKPELAKLMVQRAQAARLPIGWVVADTVYGHSPDLRLWLEEQGYAYAMAVPSTEAVCVQTRAGMLLSDVVSIAHQALRARDWQRLSASLGTKGERLFDWARLPLVHRGVADGRHFLVIRRCLDDPHELAYYLVFAPPGTSLHTMVLAIGARWSIEVDLENAKDLGLDHYEVRSYVGWYRHITLVLLASAFLVGVTVQPHLPGSASHAPPACSPLIPLTTCEVRHLLARLIFPASTSAPLICHWSIFRRTHQYWAGYYHRRRRTKAGSASVSSQSFLPLSCETCLLLSGKNPGVFRGVLLASLPALFRGKLPGLFPGGASDWLSFLLHAPRERSYPMTFVSLADASRRLGIDVKTLRRWLAEAQLALQCHPHDGRKKGLSDEHLLVLARLHQRSLASSEVEVPAQLSCQIPALPADLLKLPEQLSALQDQIAALRASVADLTGLLQSHEQASATPAAQAQPTRASSCPSKPAPPAPRSRPAAKTPRKPVHVIPRVEYGEQGQYVVICPQHGLLPFEPDTEAWFAWVAEQDALRFVGKWGHFTAHHEWRVPNGAWRAHRHIRNHSYTLRLAPTANLTIAVLEQAAATLQAHLT